MTHDFSHMRSAHRVLNDLRNRLRVLKAVYEINGGDWDRARFWCRNEPLGVFGNKTAEELVAAGRTDDLLRYIQSLEAGTAG